MIDIRKGGDLDSANMRIAVVGLGYWGPKLLRSLAVLWGEDRIVAVDICSERLAAVRMSHPQVRCVETLQEALTDPRVKAVIISTPLSTHAELARMAMSAGCAVLVEKPLAGSVADARDLVEQAAAGGHLLMVAHTFLFSPRIQWLGEYIRSGELGDVLYATSSRLNLGLHRSDASVIWDLAPHDFSILFHLLGEFPRTVQTSARSIAREGTCDVAFMNLSFDSGIIASVDVSWMAPRKIRNTALVGDRKMAVYDDTDNEAPVKIYDRGITRSESQDFGEHQLTYRYGDTVSPYISPREPLGGELSHFLDCVLNGTPCLSDGWFGLRIVEALEAAENSRMLGGAPAEVGQVTEEIDVYGRAGHRVGSRA
jgi:predicted dehydrogenase